MKFIHLSDIHIGKIVNEFSMLDSQREILSDILNKVFEIKPDGVIIAGDVYDKSVPSAAGVELFDDFLTKLANTDTSVFIIAGNHDSPERLSFGSKLMQKNRVYISGGFTGKMDKYTLTDKYGNLNIFLLPFIKPAYVRRFFTDKELLTYNDAACAILNNTDIDLNERNILVAHQFITKGESEPEKSLSESISAGGVDNIDVSLFDKFDYVALGHLHNPQKIGRDTVRYCGSPLKYSFSECRYNKSLTVVELNEKGEINIELIPLAPKRDLREIRGDMESLTSKEIYEQGNKEDYMHITLTDEEDIMDPLGKLRQVYPNIMRLDFDNSRTKINSSVDMAREIERKSGTELFCEFYKQQNNKEPSKEKMEIIKDIFSKLEGE